MFNRKLKEKIDSLQAENNSLKIISRKVLRYLRSSKNLEIVPDAKLLQEIINNSILYLETNEEIIDNSILCLFDMIRKIDKDIEQKETKTFGKPLTDVIREKQKKEARNGKTNCFDS